MVQRITYANVTATLALVVALGGSAYAVSTITGADVRNESLTGLDIRNGTITGGDIRRGAVNSDDIENGSITQADLHAGVLAALAGGAQGPAGPKGDPGPAGPKGDPGAAGAKGDAGVPGPAGANGTNGTNGTNGSNGAPGRGIVSGSVSLSSPLGDTTTYAPLSDWNSTGTPTEASAQTLSPSVPVTLGDLAVASDASPGLNNEIIVSLRVDGVSVLACSMSNADTSCANAASAVVPAGSLLSMEFFQRDGGNFMLPSARVTYGMTVS
jgi:hypothetical protein